MRHSISVGGRLRPPPKNWSYSILSWRMSFSSCASSSSIVAMAKGPPFHMLGGGGSGVNKMHRAVEPIQHGDWLQLAPRPISDGTLGRCGPPRVVWQGLEGGELAAGTAATEMKRDPTPYIRAAP